MPKPAPAEPEDQSGTITAEQLCSWTGFTDRRHRQLAAAGWFPPPIKGRYQPKALIGMIRYLVADRAKKDDGLSTEQKGYAKVRRLTAELKYEKTRGAYVEKALLIPALKNISAHQRATLIRMLEQELAPKLSGLTTAEIIPLIKSAVEEVCRMFREGVAGWMAEPPE